jgi:hypothetical protein
MKVDIEQLIGDQEIKEVLYALEGAEHKKSKEEVLDEIWGIRSMYNTPPDDDVHCMLYSCIGEYGSGLLDLTAVKEEIFSLLDEYGVIKR